jgi:FHA domain
MMLICPNCHHEEVIGAIFCSECGSQLAGENAEATQFLQGRSSAQAEENGNPSTATPPIFIDAAVSLYIMDSGQMIPLEGQSEFTLGRNAEGQSVISDIDLTPFRGYEQGVSRLHTSITIEENHVSATDLGSANGTRINGQKIPSYRPYPVQHGDIITLGKLKIQILIHR